MSLFRLASPLLYDAGDCLLGRAFKSVVADRDSVEEEVFAGRGERLIPSVDESESKAVALQQAGTPFQASWRDATLSWSTR